MNKIYLDMDGVIADCFGGFASHYKVKHWKDVINMEDAIKDLRNTDFFYRLEELPNALDLIDFCQSVEGFEYGICSTPLFGDYNNSAYWKRRWLESRMYMPKVENCIFTDHKEKFATNIFDGSPNILIDDKPTNIASWNKAGGIGIRYQANEDDYSEYLIPKLEDAIDFIRTSRFKV